MDERKSARAEINHSRERMKDIAAQLAHRGQPSYVKEKAKEAAVEKSVEIKDKVVSSPIALGIIGGFATAVIAKRVIKRRQDQQPQGADERFEGETLSARASEQLDDVKHAAGDLKDKAVQSVEHLREQLPSREDVKTKAREVKERTTAFASDEPLITALGALAVGAALGFLLPLSTRERRLLAPAREKVTEKLDLLGAELDEKVHAKVDQLHDEIVKGEFFIDETPARAGAIRRLSCRVSCFAGFVSGRSSDPRARLVR